MLTVTDIAVVNSVVLFHSEMQTTVSMSVNVFTSMTSKDVQNTVSESHKV